MHKKIVSLCLAAALFLAFWIFRSSVGDIPRFDSDTPVSITVWHYYNGAQKNAFDSIVEKFNDSVGRDKGIIVESVSQGGVNELANKLISSAKGEPGAEEMPNIFAAYNDIIYDLDAMGIVAPLDGYISSDEIGQFRECCVREAKSLPGGQFKIFPVAKSTELLYINKTDWDKFVHAVTVDDRDKKYEDVSNEFLATWEGIYKAAKVYYKWTDDSTPSTPGDGRALFGIDSLVNFELIGNKQLGVDLISVEGGRGIMNINYAVEKRIWNFYYKGMINGYFGAFGRFRSDDVKTGDLLMYVGASSAGPYIPAQVTLSDGYTYPIESAVLPLPVFEGGDKVAIQQGAGMAVKKSTSREEYACLAFLKYFTEAEGYLDFVFDTSYIPVRKDVIESKELLNRINFFKENGDVQQNNIAMAMEVSLMQFKDYEMYYAPPFPGSFEVRTNLEARTADLGVVREEVLNKVRQGVSIREAARKQLGDESYREFIDEMKKDFEEVSSRFN